MLHRTMSVDPPVLHSHGRPSVEASSSTMGDVSRYDDNTERIDPQLLNVQHSNSWTDQITILAGEEETPFLIHREKICACSPVIRNACTGSWIEARERTVWLPDISSKYFSRYAEWVYTKRITSTQFEHWAEKGIPKAWKLKSRQLHYYCEFWVHADYLGDGALKNAIMEILSNKDGLYLAELLPETAKFVWENSLDNSGIRRWVVAMLLLQYQDDTGRLERVAERLPHDLLKWLLIRKFENSAKKDHEAKGGDESGEEDDEDDDEDDDDDESLFDGDRCRFHDHGPGVPTCEA